MITIKNETLLNNLFSSGMQSVCSKVWGREIDEKLFALLDEVTKKQNDLNRLYKKYYADAKINPAAPTQASLDQFNTNFGPILEDSSEIEGERLTLIIKGGNQISAMERYTLKEILDIKNE